MSSWTANDQQYTVCEENGHRETSDRKCTQPALPTPIIHHPTNKKNPPPPHPTRTQQPVTHMYHTCCPHPTHFFTLMSPECFTVTHITHKLLPGYLSVIHMFPTNYKSATMLVTYIYIYIYLPLLVRMLHTFYMTMFTHLSHKS